ncbi:winged helix-turn-helix domain-containing protein [Pseudoduganella violaceinigra]|uniref:winged helix-turn-helix domain-containing protein n=1 Tax=Pseudoduganella violaceinigra TaxID=246602 RepID=UPI000480DDA1|nr:winged helix-turn-helix domain-containing protein [Pseudoduganella violaceinigra]
MSNSPSATLRVGDWRVNRLTGELARDGACLRLEERSLRLLTCLADRAGDVLSAEELLAHAWPGVVVSPDSLYQAITLLRRQLGDDARNPRYIATVSRRGYRLVAAVSDTALPADPAASPLAPAAPPPAPRQRKRIALFAGVAAVLAGLAALPLAMPGSRSVAVLPFLDLTDEMNEEPFADGISEELIGKLSRQPGLSVAPPGASYYYKDKRATAAEVARALKVAYVLDGSVRRSGGALRIAARLTRAADGFVVWSDSYDRTPGDKLAIQAEIATAVSRAAAAQLH